MTTNNNKINFDQLIQRVSINLNYDIYRNIYNIKEYISISSIISNFNYVIYRAVNIQSFEYSYLNKHVNNVYDIEEWLNDLTYYKFFNLVYVFRRTNDENFMNLCNAYMNSDIKNDRIRSNFLTSKSIPILSYDY